MAETRFQVHASFNFPLASDLGGICVFQAKSRVSKLMGHD